MNLLRLRRSSVRRRRHSWIRHVTAILGAGVALYAVALLLTAPSRAQPAQSPACTATAGGGVVRVGPTRTLTTLASGVAAANAGDTICLDAGDYPDSAGVIIDKPLRILGVGGRARLVATGNLTNMKGLIVSQADLEVVNLEFADAIVRGSSGGNGAGIRKESGSLIVRDSNFVDNQNGILANNLQAVSPGATVLVENSSFYNNGSGTGQTHGIYVVGAASAEYRGNYFEGTNHGHHLKTLAEVNIVIGNTFEDSNDPAFFNPSYSLDLERGGVAVVQDNTFIQRLNGTNFAIVNYGGRASGHHPVGSLEITGNTIINDKPGAVFLRNSTLRDDAQPPPVVATVTGNQIIGIATNNVISGQPDPPRSANSFAPFSAPVLKNNGVIGLTTGTPDRSIREYAPDGSLQTIIEQTDGIAGNSGVTKLGDTVYVANNAMGIAAIEGIGSDGDGAPTGTSTFYFGGSGIEALATDGTDLFAGVFEDSSILRFDTSGTLLDTIELDQDVGITGLAWFDNIFYVANYYDGNVYTFDMLGRSIGSPLFSTGIGADLLSGLAYDMGTDETTVDDDSIWLATGFAADGGEILRYDLAGQQLGGFAAASVQGLRADGSLLTDVSDGGASDIPEPGMLTILVPAAALLFRVRRSRR